MIADQYLHTHLWDLLWSRISQSLKPSETNSERNNDDLISTLANPDWTLLSPNGYLSLLQLGSRMLTMSPQNCASLILKQENVMFDTISHMLSENFLLNLKNVVDEKDLQNTLEITRPKNGSLSSRRIEDANIENEETGDHLVCEFIIIISQLLCFPFAIDSNEEIITNSYKIIKEFNLFSKIINGCILYSSCLKCDIPIGLVARLILTDDDLVQLMIDQLNNSTQVIIRINYHI